MPSYDAAFMGTALPRAGLRLLAPPFGRRLLPLLPLSARPPRRARVLAITRRVADIRYYPEQDKESRRARRLQEKRDALKARRKARDTPRGFGDRPGAGVGGMYSPDRVIAERDARMRFIDGKPGMRDILCRMTGMLTGGKADHLLYLLRARFLERLDAWVEEQEDVRLTEDVRCVYAALVDEILLCDRLYYCDEPTPRVADVEYDEMVMHLLELERVFPELIVPESPSQNVAHGAAARGSKLGLDGEMREGTTALESSQATVLVSDKLFPQYQHKALMLSLDNAYAHDDLVAFGRRADEAASPIAAELKIDGVALSLEYRRGKLFKAATRGTGRIGDDITENVRASLLRRGVVEEVTGEHVPDFMLVRGEVYITRDDFAALNEKLERKLSNPRNAAAGALKHKNPLEARDRGLRFIAYECLRGDLAAIEECETAEALASGRPIAYPELEATFETQAALYPRLADWGFGEMPRHKVCANLAEAEAFAVGVEDERASLPVEVDGIVFKFEISAARQAAGHTARAPRGAIAYKFTAQARLTILNDVVMQVSRSGLITPVAILAPIRVGGAVLSRATLHNFDEVKRLGVAIGDTVRVQRGGDVIPKVINVEEPNPSVGRTVVKPPTQCPSCLGEIMTETDPVNGALLVGCKNGGRCAAQVLGRLVHFASKDAMDINGLGKKTATKMVDSGHIVVIADLFRITVDDLLSLEGFAEKSANSLVAAIKEAATGRSLERIIYGLGFPGVGSTGARALAVKVGSLSKLLELASNEHGADELQSVPNFAEKSATAVHEYLKRDRTQAELKAMIDLVDPAAVLDEDVIDVESSGVGLTSVMDKTFVFTGKLAVMSRPNVLKWIKKAGGKVANTVSNKTDFVVAGLEPGQKYFKAQRLKIKILQEEEFLALFKPSEEDSKLLRNTKD